MGYGTVARLLHWIMAILILGMIPVGLIMIQEGLPRSVQDPLFIFHKNVGSLLLVLVAIRLVWRLLNPAPPLPEDMPRWMKLAARVNHAGLYLAIMVMAVSGYMRVRLGGFPIEFLDAVGVPRLPAKDEPAAEVAKAVHYATAFVVVALLAVHIGAALYHGLVRRDGVFGRMWPPVARRRRPQAG